MADDRFTLKCIGIAEFPKLEGQSDWKSYWHNVSEEGIVTEVTFTYYNCNGLGDSIGMEIDMTIHDSDSTESGKVNL